MLYNAILRERLRAIVRQFVPDSLRRIYWQRMARKNRLSIRYVPIVEWPKPQPGATSSWISDSVTNRLSPPPSDATMIGSAPAYVRDVLSALSRTGLASATCLDYGCGSGQLLPILKNNAATQGWRYAGADINSRLIEACRVAYPGVEFHSLPLDSASLMFEDNSFDVILAVGVVHCIEDWQGLLAELHRIGTQYVLVARLPLFRHTPSQIVLQKVQHRFGMEEHAIHILNRRDFEQSVKALRYEVAFSDYGTEIYFIPGIEEPSIGNLYLLNTAKRNLHI